MTKKSDTKFIQNNIELVFIKLIGCLSIMEVLKLYQEDKDNLSDILNIVVEWSSKYYENKNLDFVDSHEFLNIYHKLDELKEKYAFNEEYFEESELTCDAVVWILQLMDLNDELMKL